MDDKNLTKAKYIEWQASIFGACGVALALGVWFQEYLRPFAVGLLILGVVLHGWGMYRIPQRNK